MAADPKKRPRPASKRTPEPEPTEENTRPDSTPAALPAEEATQEQDAVLIERRYQVATIPLEEDGDLANAITLAFATAAEYIAARVAANENDIELEFVIGDRLFTAAVEENE